MHIVLDWKTKNKYARIFYINNFIVLGHDNFKLYNTSIIA